MKVSKKDDDLFISKMIEETYSFLPEYDTSKGAGDLLSYFDMRGEKEFGPRVETFLQEEGVDYFEATYIESIKCFRIKLFERNIDFPQNWSVFRSLYKFMSIKNDGIFWIDIENDDNFLLEVLCPFVKYESELAFLVKDGRVFLVFTPLKKKDIHDHLNNFMNFKGSLSEAA